MANDWFKFKKFTIKQSGAAMKVGTDGVLLGAWAKISENAISVLDIGAGTGLLSLMIAQRFSLLNIKAIEIDQDATRQCFENFQNSEWTDRLEVECIDFQNFVSKSLEKYDMIISNPPYFIDSLEANTHSRTRARHQHSLSLNELFVGVANLLNPNGLFNIIIPFDQCEKALKIAETMGLFPSRMLLVRPNPGKAFKRILMEFSRIKQVVKTEEMIIEMDKRHEYSSDYKNLTRDFYLAF